MKYMKRAEIYKAANVTFDPKTIRAYSYEWWCFVKPINGKIIFNAYRYSVTTAKHQAKVERLMSELGLRIDQTVECPKGLQDLNSAIDLYRRRIDQLNTEIAKPRSHKRKNDDRRIAIGEWLASIKRVNLLMTEKEKRFS